MPNLLNLEGLRRRWRLQLLVAVVIVLALLEQEIASGQQTYLNNQQFECQNQRFNSITRGYHCNSSSSSSCRSYLTFRSETPYDSPANIGYLLGAQESAPLIASINNISSVVSSIPTDTQVIVPVSCSCVGGQFYQHNASYTLEKLGTYFSVANNTYQGLTTCQALMFQNAYSDVNLTVGLRLLVPLRCACPSSNQTALGIKYLLTYMVTWGETISSITELFDVDQQAVLDANRLSATDSIYPFTPILVPLTKKPTKIESPPAAASPSPSPQSPVIPVGDGNKKKKWLVYMGVGMAVALLFLILSFWYRKSHEAKPPPVSPSASKMPKSRDSTQSLI